MAALGGAAGAVAASRRAGPAARKEHLDVVLASVRYPPAPGGAETHVQALAEGLLARGHGVVVHTSDLHTEYPFVHKALPTDVNGVRVVRHPARRLLGAWTTMPTLAKALGADARRADVVHAHSYGYYHTSVAARAARRAGKPFVFTPHYHPPWSMEGGAGRRALRKLYDPLVGARVLAAADRIVAVSSGELEELRRHLPADPARTRIIPNGFHASRFSPQPSGDAFRARVGAPARAPLVVFAGRLASNKGLPVLVDAFGRLAKSHPDARLALAGEDQGWRGRLEAQARALGVAERVRFTGHLDEASYRSALAAADVFVLPSEWEAFGIVLAEAMACGVPCVATRVGGAPDVVQDGVTGTLVPYGDAEALAGAIGALLSDRALAARMGAAGRERALREFSWDAVVDRTIGVYREVLTA